VNAKRASYAHVLFNVFGVLWITAVFPFYIRLVASFIEGVHGTDPTTMALADFADPLAYAAVMTAGIALTHTGFNVMNTLLFLPFLGPYTRLLERIVPDPAVKEVARLKHLDARAVSAPVLGVEQSRGEVIKMGRQAVRMMEGIRAVAADGEPDKKAVRKVIRREEVLDNMQQEVITFLTEVLDASVPHAIAEEGQQQLRIAHEYESMGDRLASVLKGYLRLRDQRLVLPDDQREELLALHDAMTDFLRDVTTAYEGRRALDHAAAQAASSAVTRQVKQLRDEHLRRMVETPVDPKLSLIYTNLLTDYRRVRAHTMNVHEATEGIHAVVPG
jgi:phosphate:Na+ symporter